jgi:hypothetical protein
MERLVVTVVLASGHPDGRPRTALRFVFHAGPAPPERQRGDGRMAPLIRKDPVVASYGCPVGAGRDDAAEGLEERCNT